MRKKDPVSKLISTKRCEVVQLVGHLFSEHEALSSIANTAQNKQNKTPNQNKKNTSRSWHGKNTVILWDI
jgi:hypothetical protein